MLPANLTALLTSDWVTCFGLLLFRAGGWATVVPLLGARGIALFARAAMATLIAFALTPVALKSGHSLPDTAVVFIFAGLGEFVVGAVIGWVTGLLFSAAELAGTLADATSGLSFAAMVDPASGNNQSSFARLFSIVFLAIAFASDAHHALIAGFARTLDDVPVGVFPAFDHGALEAIVNTVMALVRAAIEIGAPLLGALFLTEVALGLVSKFYPQANILVIGLGVKAMVALSTAGLALMLLPGKVGPLVEWGLTTLQGVW